MNDTPELRAEAVVRRIRLLGRPVGVEVGVCRGDMSVQLLRQHRGLHLILVDSWAPEDQQPNDYKTTGDVHAFLSSGDQNSNYRKALHALAPYRQRMVIQRDPSTVAAQRLRGPYDFVFLDADHSEAGVYADVRAWWPTLKVGGWLCGHDYDGYLVLNGERRYFGVTDAVDRFSAERGLPIELDSDNTFFIQKKG